MFFRTELKIHGFWYPRGILGLETRGHLCRFPGSLRISTSVIFLPLPPSFIIPSQMMSNDGVVTESCFSSTWQTFRTPNAARSTKPLVAVAVRNKLCCSSFEVLLLRLCPCLQKENFGKDLKAHNCRCLMHHQRCSFKFFSLLSCPESARLEHGWAAIFDSTGRPFL